ncbi:MAG: glutathione peroxidase [Deltaproteobacteria bacterium]|nr:glutathione peroxidase [Deltaproteobacteria bacterium]
MVDINGQKVSLDQFKGKTLLVVNTASKCGFTPQYKDLENIYQNYQDNGLIVLGFPSNDFGAQEPGTEGEVKNFCEKNYGVTFPLFAKSSVKRGGDNVLFQKLIKITGQEPGWNFSKYLIEEDGKKVTYFKSADLDGLNARLSQLFDEE